MTKQMRISIGVILCSLVFCSAQAAVVISDVATTYTQDFNTLPFSGTALTWANNSTISGWYRNYNGGTTEPGRDASVQSSGANNSGVTAATGFFNTGVDGNTDRSVTLRAVSYVTEYAVGAVYENNSGSAASGFSIGFTGEQWRRDSSVTNALYFEYAVVSSSLNEGTLDIQADDLGWTRVDALEFVPPSLGSDTGLNGSNPAYQQTFSPVPVITSVEDGEFLVVRWLLEYVSGNNHALGIDDVSITLTAPSATSGVIAGFDFENHTAGILLSGSVGTARTTSGAGDAFDYNDNGGFANVTVSVLSESGPGDLNYIGANVRSDTVAATVPGGNVLELSPHRLTNQSLDDISPTGSVDYITFSVQADAGYALNLSSFSFDLGVGRGASDAGTIAFMGQGWFSLDGGASWDKMKDVTSVNNTAAQSFTGFTTVNADLAGFTGLQNLTNQLLIAVSLGDNSGRSAYSATSINPAAYYLDNIELNGSVGDVVVFPAGQLAAFDFENHIAGTLIPGTDPAPRPLAGRGETFDYISNGSNPNATLSVLSEFGPGDFNDNYGAYICADTLHNSEPGGNFITVSPYRLTDSDGGDMDPSNIASNDYFQFSIQANSGQVLSLDSFSFDLASYMVTNNIPAYPNDLTFYAQGWYAVPSVSATNWVKMQDTLVLSTTTAQNWVGFTNVTVDLSGVSELQGVAGEILVALALGDNNDRATQVLEEGAAEYYLDNLNLFGTVTAPALETDIDDIAIDGANVLLSWNTDNLASYNVWTNGDLVSGGWGVDDTVLGTGGSITWTSAVTDAASLFYKVERVAD